MRSYGLLVAASLPQGVAFALGNNYRFLASASAAPSRKATVIAIVLLGVQVNTPSCIFC
jgi:hypothetical protein